MVDLEIVGQVVQLANKLRKICRKITLHNIVINECSLHKIYLCVYSKLLVACFF